jgi:hypothetical protein
MKKLTATLGLIVISVFPLTCNAQWIYVAEGTGAYLFYDKASLINSGQKKEVWIYIKYKEQQKTNERSAKEKWEVDCKAIKVSRVAAEIFLEDNLSGSLGSFTSNETITPPSGSPIEDLYKFLCAQ